MVFESLFHRDHEAKVAIVDDGTVEPENRAGCDDRAGAPVDMIQSHPLQVLALVTMEPHGPWTPPISARPGPRPCAPRVRWPETR